jgi:hypothetical protein
MNESVTQAADEDAAAAKEMLLLFSGAALAVFSAGLILSSRHVRQLLGQVRPGAVIQAAVPDLKRYLKLRAM